ncbi:hypothetical protein ACFPYM_03770 [Methylobacterium hispanicum]|uniref:hypothetical protein n=1 Tax=Methylobacterium hispanicum TaxID=270350 RepID=UPI001EDECA70|nr:hypothetical protein [Methylobacterium hispanicum]
MEEIEVLNLTKDLKAASTKVTVDAALFKPRCAWTIAYAYDALGRMRSRTVSGSGAETVAYDTLGRA